MSLFDQRKFVPRLSVEMHPALRALCSAALPVAIAVACFWVHFNLSTVGSLELLLIVLVALRWGFREALLTSFIALGCLNFLFTAPVFHLTVDAPENWISLIAFLAAALLVSALSSRVRNDAAQSENQLSHLATLYELGRGILLMDRQKSTVDDLAALIRKIVQVNEVEIWHVYRTGDESTSRIAAVPLAVFRSGRNSDESLARTSNRILRAGAIPIGAMVLRGWEVVPTLADAVASLTALALERARSLDKETRAEAGRHTEQLRTVVLDGLAHAFKTPLTAIMTASSGLLEIGSLSAAQMDLVTLIDQEATRLNHLSTRLLQTASLEAQEVRLQRRTFALEDVLDEILRTEMEAVHSRVRICMPEGGVKVSGDPQMVHFALAQLIDNAAKYSAIGSPIDVTLHHEGLEIVITVENTGSPVKQEDRERIFERFYRSVDPAHAPPGTGLGLSIVRKTAEAHSGRAWVESDLERTRFFFTLPQVSGVTHG